MTSNSPPPAPQTIYLKDYQPPAFLVDEISLDIHLDAQCTLVTSTLKIRPNQDAGKQPKILKLDGENIELISLKVEGKKLRKSDYKLSDVALIVTGVPEGDFTVEIKTSCDPSANRALSGLYRSRGIYCTQCEAEGFRRITFFPDRPDILSVYTTRIEAERADAPELLPASLRKQLCHDLKLAATSPANHLSERLSTSRLSG